MMLEQFGHCPNQWWSLAILVKISMGKVYFTLLDYFYVFIMFALQSQTVSRGFALRQMRSRFFWYLFLIPTSYIARYQVHCTSWHVQPFWKAFLEATSGFQRWSHEPSQLLLAVLAAGKPGRECQWDEFPGGLPSSTATADWAVQLGFICICLIWFVPPCLDGQWLTSGS